MEKDVISIDEAADRLGISREGVRRRILAGDLTATRVGWSYVLSAGEVQALIEWEQQRRAVESQRPRNRRTPPPSKGKK